MNIKINVKCSKCKKRYSADAPSIPGRHTVSCPFCGEAYSFEVTAPGASNPPQPHYNSAMGADAVARNVRRCEIISSVAWLVVGVIQCVLVVSLAAGVWNVVNAILCLRNVKSVVAHNSVVVPYFEQRKVWLIVLAIVNLVLGGVVGVVLVLFDWLVRDYVLRNRSTFEV